MRHGSRLVLQLAATVATAFVVARAAQSAHRVLFQDAPNPPRHRSDRRHPNSRAHVIELEASGELDDELSPTDRLLARRHAFAAVS